MFYRVHRAPDNLFFHVSEVVSQQPQDGQSRLELQKTLFPGDHVEFDIVRSDRDPGAFIAKQVTSCVSSLTSGICMGVHHCS